MTVKNIQTSSGCQHLTSIMHYQSQNIRSTAKSKDTIESTKSCRSFCQCVLECFIFIPLKFIASIFKTIIWAISFGTFFSRTFDLKKVQTALEEIYRCFSDKKATPEQKKAEWGKFVVAFSGYPNRMVEELIEADRNVMQQKEKVKKEKIAEWTTEWNKDYLKTKRESYTKNISVDYDPLTIKKYKELLDKKNKTAATK